MPFTEDLAAFINADTPGYVLATVGGSSVAAIFDNGYADALGIAGSGPLLIAASSAVSSAALGTSVSVGGVSYTVSGIEPDGMSGSAGLTMLRLQEV